jgi:hypothetical protein
MRVKQIRSEAFIYLHWAPITVVILGVQSVFFFLVNRIHTSKFQEMT